MFGVDAGIILNLNREWGVGVGVKTFLPKDFNNYDTMMPTDFQTQMDSECQRENYQPTLVDGLRWTLMEGSVVILICFFRLYFGVHSSLFAHIRTYLGRYFDIFGDILTYLDRFGQVCGHMKPHETT